MDIITALEKITSFTYFLSLISLALFVDLYLIHNYNIVIWQVDIEWLKAHAITIDISAFVIWFVLFYIFAVPLLHRIVINLLTLTYLSIPVNLRYPSSSINRPYHIHINILRDFAIQHNNASAYKLYEETRDKHNTCENNKASTQNNCFSIATFMLVLLFHSSPLAVYEEINLLPWFIGWSLLGFVWLIFYEIWAEITRDSFYDNYIYLPALKSWNNEKSNTSVYSAATQLGGITDRDQ